MKLTILCKIRTKRPQAEVRTDVNDAQRTIRNQTKKGRRGILALIMPFDYHGIVHHVRKGSSDAIKLLH